MRPVVGLVKHMHVCTGHRERVRAKERERVGDNQSKAETILPVQFCSRNFSVQGREQERSER